MVGTQGLPMCMYMCIYIWYSRYIYDAQHAYGEHVECKLNQGWCGG